jgi:hypothetical protein
MTNVTDTLAIPHLELSSKPQLHVTITMHVPLILAMLKLDVSLPRRIAQDLMHVTLEDVML